jgi:hypothetical protein
MTIFLLTAAAPDAIKNPISKERTKDDYKKTS